MGHTHYWGIKKDQGYKEALVDIRRLIKTVIEIEPALLANGLGSIGTEPEYEGHIWFNGVESAGHESFGLTEELKEPISNLCKTNRKPYDVVVTACLVILKHHMRDNVEIKSDGGDEAFNEGRELVKTLLNIDVE